MSCDTLRIVERWTLVDADTILYSATIHDPNVYARPWTMAVALRRSEPEEMLEDARYEGLRDYASRPRQTAP